MNADRSSLIQDFLKSGRTGSIKADTLLSNCWVDNDGGSKAMLEYLLLEESGCFRDGHDKVAIDSMLAGENLLLVGRYFYSALAACALTTADRVNDNAGLMGGFEQGSAGVYGNTFAVGLKRDIEMPHI
jgi:hypothetical protein